MKIEVGDLVMLPSSAGYIGEHPHLKLIGIVTKKWGRLVNHSNGVRDQEYVNVQWANGNECHYEPDWLEVLCK
tara:strand:+ start:101 stop:319 length:219 start_codon:yes stop_codon:yes gene_type:complete